MYDTEVAENTLNDNKIVDNDELIVYKIGQDQWLANIMEKIPYNVIIDKTICANGASHLFMEQDDNTALLLPLVPAILDKVREYSGSYGVYSGVEVDEIAQYLYECKVSGRNIKLVMTPESIITKLKKAVTRYNELYPGDPIDMYNDIVVMFDEFHMAITEYDYRKDPYIVLDGIMLEFKNVTLVSATPVTLSDPKFKKRFRNVKIKYDKPLNTPITTISAERFLPSLIKLLREKMKDTNKIFLYINSVTYMRDIMVHIGQEYPNQISLHCAEDQRNVFKLKDFEQHMVSKDSNSPAKKLNIYTSSGNSSWPLREIDPVIIFATDANKENARQSIHIQGFQFVGRARKGFVAKEIIHITNTNGKLKSDRNPDNYKKIAQFYADSYNDVIIDKSGIMDSATLDRTLNLYLEASEIIPKSEFSEKPNPRPTIRINEEGLADLDYGRIDWCNFRTNTDDQYESPDTVFKAWENCGYKPSKPTFCTESWSKQDKKAKLEDSKPRDRVKEIADALYFFKNSELGTVDHKTYLDTSKKHSETFVKYLDLLGYNRFEALSFDKRSIEKEYALQHDQNIMNSLRFLKSVYGQFAVGGKYRDADIKRTLKSLYKSFRLIDNTPTSNDIKHFFTTPGKKVNTRVDGKPFSGWELTGKKFQV